MKKIEYSKKFSPLRSALKSMIFLFVTLFFNSLTIHGETLSFSLDKDTLEQGETLTITNTSGELPRGAEYTWVIEACQFIYEGDFVCSFNSKYSAVVFSGYYLIPGVYHISLYAIGKGGDTLEYIPYIDSVVVIFGIQTYPEVDSCPDSTAYGCNHQNLVCNGSFEWTYDTVDGTSQINYAAPWRNLLWTTDLFSEMSQEPDFSVPDNRFTYQSAYHGSNYSGVIIMQDNWDAESITAQLKDTLLQGQRYGVEFWINKSDYSPVLLSGMQAGFSEEELQPTDYDDLLSLIDTNWILNPLGDSLIEDTANWIRFYDVFLADTNTLQWLMIGFLVDTSLIMKAFDNSISNPYIPGIFDNSGIYFIDDVSVEPLPPSVSLPDTVKICHGDTVTLRIQGEGAKYYYWSTGGINDSLQVSPSFPTTYTVTVTAPSGCYDDTIVLSTHVTFYDDLDSINFKIIGFNNDCDSIAKYWSNTYYEGCTYEWKISDSSGYFTDNQNYGYVSDTKEVVYVHWTSVPGLPAFSEITLIVLSPCGDTLGQDTFNVYQCCHHPEGTVNFDNDTLTSHYVVSGVSLSINGNLVVDSCVFYLADPLNPYQSNQIFFGPMASITLVNDASIKLVKTFVKAGCDYMWNSIHAPTSATPEIQIIRSQVEDGISAIRVDSAAPIMLDSSKFVNNYRGVVYKNGNFNVKDSSFLYSTYPGIYHTIVDHCTFSQEHFPDEGLPYPPLEDTLSHSGIYIDSVSTMMIGHPTFDTNHFSNMLYGIFAESSRVQVFNSVFEDFGNTSLTYTPDPSAIYSNRHYGFQQFGSMEIGRDSAGYANRFVSCELAVQVMNQTMSVRNNYFLNCDVGIKAINPLDSAYIVGNKMYRRPRVYQGVTGIQVQSVMPRTPPDIVIDTNYIEGFKKGIWATNLNGNDHIVRINADTILFTFSSPGTNTYSGIKAENCDGADISHNIIAGMNPPASIDTGQYNGIWVSATGAASVGHNRILRVGHGIYTTGSCLLTEFICNDLDSCYHGFYFGPHSALSDQGSIDENPNNRYLGDYSQGGYNFYRRMGGIDTNITNPIIDWYYEDQYSEYDPGVNTTGPQHQLNAYINDIENNLADDECSYDSTVYDPFSISSAGERDALFSEILRGRNLYQSNVAYNRNHEQELFFNAVAENPEIMVLNDSSDVIYQKFFDSLSIAPQGERYDIMTLMAMGYFKLARQANASYSPADVWGKSRKTVNQIYLDTWVKNRYRYKTDEKDSLLKIAFSSPYTHGDAVYSARVMLGLDPDNHHLTYRTPSQNVDELDKTEIMVYPNPASIQYCFKLKNASPNVEQAYIARLFDVSGRLIYTEKIQLSSLQDFCRSRANLHHGIYLIHLSNLETGEQHQAKLILH